MDPKLSILISNIRIQLIPDIKKIKNKNIRLNGVDEEEDSWVVHRITDNVIQGPPP